MLRTRLGLGLLLAIALIAGCSDSYDGRMEVSGKVSLKGQPAPDGAIVMFEALDNQDTGGNVTCTGGEYLLPRPVGLKPGRYLVRITAGDGRTPVNPTDPNAPPGPTGGSNIVSKDLFPPDWNVNSKNEITVTADGPNKFNFDVP